MYLWNHPALEMCEAAALDLRAGDEPNTNVHFFGHPFTADFANEAERTKLPGSTRLMFLWFKDKANQANWGPKQKPIDLAYGKLGNTSRRTWNKDESKMVVAEFNIFKPNPKATTAENRKRHHFEMHAQWAFLYTLMQPSLDAGFCATTTKNGVSNTTFFHPYLGPIVPDRSEGWDYACIMSSYAANAICTTCHLRTKQFHAYHTLEFLMSLERTRAHTLSLPPTQWREYSLRPVRSAMDVPRPPLDYRMVAYEKFHALYGEGAKMS